ncbi:MAG TPA: ABC transporter ATP-binding protein [Clostridiaceae bacterium]
MVILEVEGLSKKYLSKQALKDINITIEKGKIVGLFGPNGSGKTTLMKIVAGLIQPTGGKLSICEHNLGYITKSLVAYLPDSDFLYDWMKIEDAKKIYVKFFDDFNTQKFNELLELMQLSCNMKVKSLSKGMKEKLSITLTLSRDAKLIVLDEPLSGVDPIAREQILQAILKGFSFESSMLITSHLINEFENIIDEVYYLKEGQIILSGNVEMIKDERHKTLDELYREVFAQ